MDELPPPTVSPVFLNFVVAAWDTAASLFPPSLCGLEAFSVAAVAAAAINIFLDDIILYIKIRGATKTFFFWFPLQLALLLSIIFFFFEGPLFYVSLIISLWNPRELVEVEIKARKKNRVFNRIKYSSLTAVKCNFATEKKLAHLSLGNFCFSRRILRRGFHCALRYFSKSGFEISSGCVIVRSRT